MYKTGGKRRGVLYAKREVARKRVFFREQITPAQADSEERGGATKSRLGRGIRRVGPNVFSRTAATKEYVKNGTIQKKGKRKVALERAAVEFPRVFPRGLDSGKHNAKVN